MNSTDRVVEFLRERGPSKVAVICKNLELGETTVRTALKGLVGIGMVSTDAGVYSLVAKSSQKASKAKARETGQAVQERDAKVLELLQNAGQLSREEIAEKLGVSSSFAYLSLYRLRRDNKVKQVHIGTRTPDWSLV